MKDSKRKWLAGLILAVLVGSGLIMAEEALIGPSTAADPIDPAALSASARPVVVELYTSQGCSSCPPADSFLGELSDLPGVLALSFHVDYWDYIGWRDTFASPAHSARQRDYKHALALHYVYTPQMVIDGAHDAAGFRKHQVYDAIEDALADQQSVAIEISADGRQVTVGEGAGPPGGATLYLAMYDHEHAVDVGRGENRGRQLVYHNVVRDYRELAKWNGEALDIHLDPSWAQGRDGCAVILQEGDTGRIIGAATIPLQGR